ncbi:Growth arrest-specific protein 1, partial [Fragariocoptes setiger]
IIQQQKKKSTIFGHKAQLLTSIVWLYVLLLQVCYHVAQSQPTPTPTPTPTTAIANATASEQQLIDQSQIHSLHSTSQQQNNSDTLTTTTTNNQTPHNQQQYLSVNQQQQRHLAVVNRLLEQSANNVLTTLLQQQPPSHLIDSSSFDRVYVVERQSQTQQQRSVSDQRNDVNSDNKDGDVLVTTDGDNLVNYSSEADESLQQDNNNNDNNDNNEDQTGDKQTWTQPTTDDKPITDCDQAYMRCALRKACAPALKAYNDECADLMANKTSQCSARCVKAMIALRSSSEGAELARCDCQSSEYCRQNKQRALQCQAHVERAMRPDVRVSCSTATWICGADQLCATALEYYYRNCETPLLSERRCTARCNNSVSILYRQVSAAKLLTCFCDGSEEFPCQKYKTYTERLCLSSATTTNNMRAQSDSDNTWHDNNSNSNSNSNRVESTSTSANDDDNYNPEDNWIPVISGRYFAAQAYAAEHASKSDGATGVTTAAAATAIGVEDETLELQAYNEFVAASLHERQREQQQQQRKRHQALHKQRRNSRSDTTSYLSFLYVTSNASSSYVASLNLLPTCLKMISSVVAYALTTHFSKL